MQHNWRGRTLLSRQWIRVLVLAAVLTSTQAQTDVAQTWNENYFPQLHITINPDDLPKLLAEGNTEKLPITLEYQGQTYTGTIRQRLGSSSSCGGKRQFRLDFPSKLTFPDGYRTDRLETDRGNCYTLHEWLSWKLVAQAAQRHPELKVLRKQANVAAVYFNGELYHVQTLLEDVGKDILEPQLGTRNVSTFKHGCIGLTGPSTIDNFCQTFSPDELKSLLDIPSFLYVMATIQVLTSYDNYPRFPYNYYWVQETTTGRIWFMPDDMDMTIVPYDTIAADPFSIAYSIDNSQRHFTELVNSEEYRELYRSYVRELVSLLQPEPLKAALATKYAQVREMLLASPDLPLGAEWYEYIYHDELPTWIDTRYQFLVSLLEQGSNQPPRAVIAPLPATMEATDEQGAQVLLNGNASSDPDQDTLTYLWQVDGQAVGQAAAASVKLAIGTHLITLTVNDGRGGTNTATISLQIVPPTQTNRDPNAVIAALPLVLEATDPFGVIVPCDGTLSSDPDNDSLTYFWQLNGQDVGQGARFDLRLSVGSHIITLIVKDGRGGTGMINAYVQVTLPVLGLQAVTPAVLTRGNATILVVKGTGFAPGAQLAISGGGVVVDTYYNRGETSISAYLTAFSFAVPGPRDVSVINPDGRITSLRGALIIR